MNFHQALQLEFGRRRERNPRYSLRAFARDLGTDHASLSQILRGRRTLSPRMVRKFGQRLQLAPGLIRESCRQLEADTILRLVRSGSCQPNSRWIATRTGLPLDTVNTALQRLLQHRALIMQSPHRWTPAPQAHA